MLPALVIVVKIVGDPFCLRKAKSLDFACSK